MSLGEHLVELRNRLMIGAAGILAGTVAGFFLYDLVWPILSNPVTVLSEAKKNSVSINFAGIATAFDVRFQVALAIGIVISSPVWLLQIFGFLTPGLTKTEKRYVFGFFFSAVPLFLAGCTAGFYVMPHIVELMASFVPANGTTFFDAKYFLDFILKLVLATGVAFVLPVFLVLLNFAGILRGKSILKGWRWAILAITLFTAAATPAADLFSMFLLAVPMVALYFGAVGLALLHDRSVDRRAAAVIAGTDADAGLPAGA